MKKNPNEEPAEQVARRLLGEGHTMPEVVEATGLEPVEVGRIVSVMRRVAALAPASTAPQPARPSAAKLPTGSTLASVVADLRHRADRPDIPKPAATKLRRAADLIGDAQDVITADAGAAKKRAELAALQAKVEALKAELRTSGRGRGNRAAQVAAGPPMAAIRKWAIDQGYDVPPAGILRKEIRAAYDAAHQAVAS